MLTALDVSRCVDFVWQNDVVQSMDLMARAAEANGQAEVEVNQGGESGNY
jgi:hypothetical protein